MKYQVSLSPTDRSALETFTRNGVHKAQEIKRAMILLKSNEGKTCNTIAQEVAVTKKTVWKIRKRYCEEGLKAALRDKPRPGAPKKVTPEIEAKVTAIACEHPPVGRRAMTLKLIQQELDDRFQVQLGYGTVQQILKDHDLKPWKKKCGASRRSMSSISTE